MPHTSQYVRGWRQGLTIFVNTLLAIGLVEVASNLWLGHQGHSNRRSVVTFNRIPSGYTVFRHTPGWKFETIRLAPTDPPAVLDAHGFLSDEPITKQKPDGVTRVFILGGSTAIGSGQLGTGQGSGGYDEIHRYPGGVYSYPHSIAGNMKAALIRRFPGRHFQVITAAAYEWRFHQSLLNYLSVIAHFAPDIVISIDGMNDLWTFTQGSPYESVATQLDTYMKLWNETQNDSVLRQTATWAVISQASRANQAQRAGLRFLKQSPHEKDFGDYQKIRGEIVANSQEFTQAIRHLRAAVTADNAEYLFAIQPLLWRRGGNKQLSGREMAFYQLWPVPPGADADLMRRSRLASAFFFDDVLSPVMKGELGEYFVDLGLAIESVPRETEVYTDYCHLTREGNRLVAEALVERIASQRLVK